MCLTWDRHIARLADTLPFVPVAVVPGTRVATAAARASLPERISHAAAAATVARAALLGAAFASQSADLFEASLHDELHEPYRAPNAPVLGAVRSDLPAGAVGATLSGSGPTVIVWAYEEQLDACAADLETRFADARVLPLRVASRGAHVA